MTPPRFQFTIAGLLWATFWVAASGAGWTIFARLRGEGGYSDAIAMLGFGAGIIFPFAAIGALFDQAAWGLVVGIVALILVFVLLVLTFVLTFFF